MSWVRKIHLYSGLVLSILLLIFALTGGALIFKDDIQRSRYPNLGAPLRDLGPEQHARAFAAIAKRFPQGVRLIRTPREDAALYHVYLDDSEAFISQSGENLVDRRRWNESLIGILTELHFHLGIGRRGSVFVGIIALALAAMVLTGLVMFWPFRTRFRIASLWPKNTSRIAWSRLHRDLGLIASIPVLLFALTAAGVIFYGAAQSVLGVLSLSNITVNPRPRIETEVPIGTASSAHIAVAQSAVPKAQLISYNPPAEGDAVHYFRFRQDGEPHPNGRTAVFVDGISGSLLRVDDALQVSRGQRAAQWLYPLHAATVGGVAYKTLAVLAAVALAVMSISGPAIYIQMRRRRPKISAPVH